MSWTSRFGNLGRFSPFSRSPPQGSTKVSDADFSYITADDLRKHHAEIRNSGEASDDFGPPRDTDILILRNKKKEYAVHFPAYSIAKGETTIGQLREHAARKLGTSDWKRIKLLYKGKNLKDDQRTCKQEGLKDGAEVLCSFAESIASPSDSDIEDEDSEFAGREDGEGGNTEGRKRRNRGKKTKRRAKREQPQQAYDQGSDSNVGGSGSAQRAPSPKPISASATPMEKLNNIAQTLHNFENDCDNFRSNPPADASKRDFEYKRLSESILAMVLLKLDGVETDGDADARARRKQLVRDAQTALNRLDEAHKP